MIIDILFFHCSFVDMLNIISTCRDILCVDINVDKRCVDHSTSFNQRLSLQYIFILPRGWRMDYLREHPNQFREYTPAPTYLLSPAINGDGSNKFCASFTCSTCFRRSKIIFICSLKAAICMYASFFGTALSSSCTSAPHKVQCIKPEKGSISSPEETMG